MEKTLAIKELLYGSTRQLKHFNAKVGMRSMPAVGLSRRHTGRTNCAKISRIGIVMDKILDGDIGVANVPGQEISYVEVMHRGVLVPMIVSFQGTPFNPPFSVLAKEGLAPSDSAYLYGVAAHLISNQITQKKLPFVGTMEAEFTKPADKLLSYIRHNNGHGTMNVEELLFLMCDFFYFAFKDMDISVHESTDELNLQLDRLTQNGSLVDDKRFVRKTLLVKCPKKPQTETKQPTLFTEPLADFFKRCKNGEFRIDYAWSDTQKSYIVPPSFLNSFIPTESFRLLLLSTWFQVKKNLSMMEQGVPYDEIMSRNPINIKVIGKPGSGKTTVIEAVLASMGYPKGLINCKDRMEEDEIEGMNKFINGSIYSIPSKAGELHSVGGAVLLEEFNLPDPGILMGALGQALAYPFILKVDGYKEYKRHPLTIYFATMNVGTEGSKPMNEALSSRFPEGHILEDVSRDEFVSILAASGYNEDDCSDVYGVYMGIINYLRKNREDLVLSITLRHCLNALEKMQIGFTKKQAYETTFISQLYSSDPEVVENIRNDVLMAVA